MIYLAILVFILLLLPDLPALIREKDKKALTVYCVLGGITLVYILQYALKIEIFSPIQALAEFVEKDLRLNYYLWQGHG